MPSHVLGKTLVVCVALVTAGAWAQERGSAPAADTPVVTPVEKGGSGVRIVRLSQVRGAVRMDRNTGRGYEAAFANIPVVAGAKLSTGQGVAEVELEDNSSLRLTPDSEVAFTELSRTAAGSTETTVNVVKGIVYVSLEKTKGNGFALTEGAAKLTLVPGAHVRLDARQPQAVLAVFEGSAELTLGAATTTIGKHQTIDLNAQAGTVSAAVRGVEEQDFDAWDKQGRDYHQQRASLAGTGGFGLYGTNDLNYYGSFVDMPGCGSMWRPYFANAAWDPFGSGVWAYYPSAGYSWVSPYPWGWLPFHSGTWASCGAAGWGWRPGGNWYGVNNIATLHVANRPGAHPLPPVGLGSSLVPVNMNALRPSGVATGERFTFRQNSAGLGVPRAEYGDLRGLANHVDRHGEAMASGFAAPAAAIPTSTHAGGEVLPGPGRMGGGGAGVAPARSSYSGVSAAPASMPSAPSAPTAGAAPGGSQHH